MSGARDLVVVGAGFAGLSCAHAAACRGLQVEVIERKPYPGYKVHTTGLLVKEVAEKLETPPALTRRIHGVRLYGPRLRYVDLEAPGYYFLATDTPGLMRWLAQRAGDAGALLRFNTPYRGAVIAGERLELSGCSLSTRYLVGADGPRSQVAQDFRLGRNRAFLTGVEFEYQGVRGVDPDRLHCFIDSELCRGYIGWAIPGVQDAVQVGLACRAPHVPRPDAFIARLARVFDLRTARIVGRRAGRIPVGGRVSRLATRHVLLAGDAAGLVSPLTAGGIHTALDSGWWAAHAIADHLLAAGPDPAQILSRSYPRFFWKRLLRVAADVKLPNALIDALISSTVFAAVARLVYFHHRGLFSGSGWQALAGGARRRPRD